MKRNNRAISPWFAVLLMSIAIVAGWMLRFDNLDLRVMHTDEAIQADILTRLWNGEGYDFNPEDYHGPILHYLSWAMAHLQGWGDAGAWTAAQLRSVPALSGFLLLFTPLLMLGALTWRGAVSAMLLAAFSPSLVYYSRYFIMETPLVLLTAFSLGCLWQWIRGGRRIWLLGCGISLGLQHATKETFILAVGAGFVSWFVTRFWFHEGRAPKKAIFSAKTKRQRRTRVLFWIAIPALMTSIAVFSAWFTNAEDVRESFTTYLRYLERAEGSGHEKPWHYYLSLIFWRKDGLIWSEGLIGGFGLIGMMISLAGRFEDRKQQRFLVFLTLYTLLLFTAYSTLAYKTPWCALHFFHPLTLLAGFAAATLYQSLRRWPLRILGLSGFAVGLAHLGQQSLRAIGPYKADSRNPFVYAHTSSSLLNLVNTVKELEALQPDKPLTIRVINRDEGWPFPWYFRGIPSVGYHTSIPVDIHTDIVIIEASMLPELEKRMLMPAYRDTGLYGLRPGVQLLMFVRNDLWQDFLMKRSAKSGAKASAAIPQAG